MLKIIKQLINNIAVTFRSVNEYCKETIQGDKKKEKTKIFQMLQQGENESLQILLFNLIKMVSFSAAHSFKNVVF